MANNDQDTKTNHAPAAPFQHSPSAFLIQAVLVIFSLAAMGIGARNGELAKIFEKATMICLQCIGIG